MLSGTPSFQEDSVGRIVWNGAETVAYRDSYLVQMPTTKVAKPNGHFDLVADAPEVDQGWSVQAIGLGFYSLSTPGASVQDVRAWATSVGAVSVEPNQVLIKQSTPANDSAYGQYLWGLNNTGTVGTQISIESRAAANLGEDPDIFPRQRDADIDAPEAWTIQTGTREVIVAVFDDGIDDTHPDLAQNMWRRPASIPLTWDNPATPGVDVEPFVGLHGFNSAEWQNGANGVDANPANGIRPGVNAFYEGSTVAPYNDPRFVSTRPGDLRLLQQRTVQAPEGLRTYVSWRGANNAHGTHVAGVIGGVGNNSLGVTGVNWAVSLYSANIFRYGDFDPDGNWRAADQTGSMTAFVDAVNRIRSLKLDYGQNFAVANLSFNTLTRSAAMETALQVLNDLGMVIVVSAGNGYDEQFRDGVGDNIGTEPYPLNDWWTFPAGYRAQFPNSMIVVTSSSARDTLPRFANFGTNVDIAAPGENIWSTVPLSARQYQPGRTGLSGGTGTDIPTQYDSFEPLYLSPTDPDHPNPPSGGGVTFTEICPVIPPPNVANPVWPGGFTFTHNVISRPLMFREVARAMQQAPFGSGPGSEAYASMSGTSMSAAYVSGAAALMAAEFHRWTDVIPSAAYVKRGIITQADVVPSLRYRETAGADGTPKFDYQHVANGVSIARTGMYERRIDAESREHRIGDGGTWPTGTPFDLRLNLFKCVDWVRNNLPPSISVVPRPETAVNRGESRIEGDPGDPGNVGGGLLWQFLYSVRFSPGTGVFSGFTVPAVPLQLRAWTQDRPPGPNSATGNVDYVSIPVGNPRTFTIPVQPAGTTLYDVPAADFSIDVITDLLPENNESFGIGFRLIPSAANTQGLWSKTRVLTDTIIDDDPTNAKPLVTVASATLSVTEDDGGIRNPRQHFVTFNLDRPAVRTVVVPYRIRQGANPGVPEAVNGTDFLGASMTVQIAQGQRTVRVPMFVIGDDVQDQPNPNPNEQFQVVIGTPNLGVKKRGRSITFVNIVDDDSTVVPPPPPGAPTLALAAPAVTVSEGNTAVFGLVLTPAVPPGGQVTVVYEVLDGTAKGGQDYVPPVAPRSVVLSAGATAGSIAVSTLSDRFVEPNETFVMQIRRATLRLADGTTVSVPIVGSASSTGTIIDANTPPVTPTVSLSGPASPVLEGQAAVFGVTVSTPVPAGWAVAVYYTVRSGTARVNSDVAGPVSGSIVIPAGDSQGVIRVSTLVDRIVEVDESFSVQVTRAILYRVGSSTTRTLSILGSPIAGATIVDTTGTTMSAAGVKVVL